MIKIMASSGEAKPAKVPSACAVRGPGAVVVAQRVHLSNLSNMHQGRTNGYHEFTRGKVRVSRPENDSLITGKGVLP